jgi:hypothetical protein
MVAFTMLLKLQKKVYRKITHSSKLQNKEKQEPIPIAIIKSLMKDLEDEISLKNTLVSEQKNLSSM